MFLWRRRLQDVVMDGQLPSQWPWAQRSAALRAARVDFELRLIAKNAFYAVPASFHMSLFCSHMFENCGVGEARAG